MKAVSNSYAILTATLLFSLVLHVDSSAQTREDVINTFNEGFALYNEEGDNLAAIEKFEETIELADQVGSEADDIRERAVGQIPRLAFMHAAQHVRDGQLENAINSFQQAEEYAEKYDDEQILKRVRGNMPALHLNLGNKYYRDERNEEAIEQYEKAIELNPSYVSAYYQMGLVYRRYDEMEQALEHFDTSIELAREEGNQEHVDRAQRAARDYLVHRASEQIEEENYNRALDLLNRASGYGESASMHYRFAEAYNLLERFDEALNSAQRALELDDGGRTDLARVYFEIGMAHKGLGNTQEACDALDNALYGDFRAPAEHQIEHELECD